MAFLELRQLRKHFGHTVAVHSIDLAVQKGEFISLLGPSGCGKTTTLRMIAGFEQPDGGQIRVDGVDITHKRPNQRNIGMVFQSYALFPNLTVAGNIGFGLRVTGHPKREIEARVRELLALIKLENLGERYPHQLSGGQQQRVALARALAIRPQLLLLDEPLSALDAKIRVALRNEIRAIQQELGITTVYVTHDQEEALSLSDRVVVMNNGLIEQAASPFEIYNFPRTRFVAHFVGTLNVLEAEVLDPSAGKLSVEGQTIFAETPLAQSAPEEKVSLALRPELLSLSQRHDPNVNELRGVVQDVSFLGSVVRVRLRLPPHDAAPREGVPGEGVSGEGTELSLDEFNNPHLELPRRGETVTITFPRTACLFLRDE